MITHHASILISAARKPGEPVGPAVWNTPGMTAM
jgi:hypothetical protein